MAQDKSTKKIGKVELTYLKDTVVKERYSDGDVEEKLLTIYTAPDRDKLIDEVLSNSPTWPMYYHLSPKRGNAISWLHLPKGTEVLEIGAGCGAVTEALLRKGVSVDAIDLSERRSLINAHRNASNENLRLIVGNLEDYKPKQKYDVVVCVGVLEYAGTFVSHDHPYEYFLQKLRSFLKPGGHLVLAIENRIGLKYWAGAREDHTGGFFDSISSYPQPKRVQTFGRTELQELLSRSGFGVNRFYYPFPDYKHPILLYSDRFYPGQKTVFPLHNLPTPTPGQSRTWLFSEALAMSNLERNNLFRDFSNSFVVLASSEDTSTLIPLQPAFYASKITRKPQYQTGTEVNDSGTLVTKTALTNQARSHIDNIYASYASIAGLFKGSSIAVAKPTRKSDESLSYAYVSGTSLERKLFELIVSGDETGAIQLIQQYILRLRRLSVRTKAAHSEKSKAVFGTPDYSSDSKVISPAVIDISFDNIIVGSKGEWTLVNYEWCFNFPIPVAHIISRSLISFFRRYGETLLYLGNRLDVISLDGLMVDKPIYTAFQEYFAALHQVEASEDGFQASVLTGRTEHPNSKPNRPAAEIAHPPASPIDQFLAIPTMRSELAEAHAKIHELSRALEASRQRLSRRIARKLRSAAHRSWLDGTS